MPSPLAHIRQVHGSDPVRDLAHAPQVMPLHTRRHGALLDLAGLIDRPDSQAPPPAPATGGLPQPGHREPAHHPYRREGVPHSPVEQPLRPLRGTVPRLLRDCPPVARGQVAGHGADVLARLQPRLHPGKAQPQQPQQLTTLPGRHGGPYSGGSSRLRSCCRHTFMIDRRLRPVEPAASPCPTAGQTPNGCCRTSRTEGLTACGLRPRAGSASHDPGMSRCFVATSAWWTDLPAGFVYQN